MFWIYKCNAQKHPRQVVFGDWDEFFQDNKAQSWGSTEWVPALIKAARGDVVIAYQSDRNELVGLARVIGHSRRGKYSDLILKPLHTIRVKVRPLKQADKAVYNIPALRPGPIQTLYDISTVDAHRLLKAAHARIPTDRGTPDSRPRAAKRGGGFGSPIENKKIEAAAMRIVSRWFRAKGWKVTDVSAQCLGYDLHCVKGRQVSHVEVKGSSGLEHKFVLTANEMHTWKVDPSFVLSLVTNINNEPEIHQYLGDRAMKSFRFAALSYMAVSNRS